MLALVIIAPLLFATTGVIDTYFSRILTQKQKEGILSNSIATRLIIGGIVSLLFTVVLFCIFRMEVFSVSLASVGSLMLSGIFRGLASIPYFQALKGNRIENITPFFQIIPLFTYVLANIVLGERLSPLSILLMVAIVIISGLFMWDFKAKKINRKGILLMLSSSLLYSCFYVGFKFWGEVVEQTRVAYFWQYVAISITLLLPLFNKHIRTSSFQYLKKVWLKLGALNIGNEGLSTMANLIVNFVSLFYSVAIVATISNGFQPIFSFILVFIASKFLPRIYTRNYRKKELAGKLVLCMISFFLLFIFYRIT